METPEEISWGDQEGECSDEQQTSPQSGDSDCWPSSLDVTVGFGDIASSFSSPWFGQLIPALSSFLVVSSFPASDLPCSDIKFYTLSILKDPTVFTSCEVCFLLAQFGMLTLITLINNFSIIKIKSWIVESRRSRQGC